MALNAETIGLALSLLANISGVVAWYNASLQKRFASELEWKKVIDNQLVIRDNLDSFSQKIEALDEANYKLMSEASQQIARKLIEIEGAINALSMAIRNKPITGWRIDE